MTDSPFMKKALRIYDHLKALNPDVDVLKQRELENNPLWQRMKDESLRPLRYPPPTVLPCANVQRAEDTVCKDPGTMACSVCKLVSYCSKECQTAHWKRHRRDCKNAMSTDWIPNGVRESHPESSDLQQLGKEEPSAGIPLWGNTPAIDVINLACNENDPNKDFSLAFVESSDLRHVLQSFNSLPSDYSGHLSILVNDYNPVIFCRTLFLLIILGSVPDDAVAADIALHFWYSTFMPQVYQFQISVLVVRFLHQLLAMKFPLTLSPRSTLFTSCPTEFLIECFTHFISSSQSTREAQDEYNRVRTAPSGQDYRNRLYASLKPSHRVAFQQYRRSGIVLPFGAKNDHFDYPNHSLFSLEGKWLQTDDADPLEGWDIPTVINTGIAHGTHPEDIYGCLYFFLSDQLRTFAARLRTFSSSFSVFPANPRKLPHLLDETGIAEFGTANKFDRVEVSNILDTDHVGLHDVLTLWAPHLEDSQYATILGHFKNWTTFQTAGQAGELVVEGLTEKEEVGLSSRNLMDFPKPEVKPEEVENDSTEIQDVPVLDDTGTFYENSQTFFQFLQSQGLDDLLRETGLRLREKHQIVPHRILAPLRGPPTALPELPDDDTRYYYTKLASHTWTERYVEFERELSLYKASESEASALEL